MDNKSLLEIRKNMVMMPVLQERIEALRGKIAKAEEEVRRLLKKYEAEALDVEKLEKNSFSAIILKNFGRYEDRLERESEEMLTAKLEYDKAVERVNDLKKNKAESEERLSLLFKDKTAFEAELKRREGIIKANAGTDLSRKYGELEAEQDALAKQLVETEEALTAAGRVLSTAGSVLGHLGKAESWATFDVWSRGGIISHLAKYEHIDNAKNEFNWLNSQLKDLQKELQDLNLTGISSIDGIDSTTRAVDFWFDNIFTDMNVRERIRDDSERVSWLRDKISGIAYKLDGDMNVIRSRMEELEQKKNDLIINDGPS